VLEELLVEKLERLLRQDLDAGRALRVERVALDDFVGA
jgi:hypothetical protein